jgi:hypothetical protein
MGKKSQLFAKNYFYNCQLDCYRLRVEVNFIWIFYIENIFRFGLLFLLLSGRIIPCLLVLFGLYQKYMCYKGMKVSLTPPTPPPPKFQFCPCVKDWKIFSELLRMGKIGISGGRKEAWGEENFSKGIFAMPLPTL